MKVQITIARTEALGKLFGFTVYNDGNGTGLPIVFRQETGTLRVSTAEAPSVFRFCRGMKMLYCGSTLIVMLSKS